MTKLSRMLAALALSVAVVAPASAIPTMLGDQILIERLFPDTSTPFGFPNNQVLTGPVVNGAADTVIIQTTSGGTPIYSWNADANALIFNGFGSSFGAPGQFGPTVFNGFRFTGFSNAISSVSLLDPTGIAAQGGVVFDASTIELDVKNSGALAGRSLTLNVTFAPVSEPGIAALFALGLVSLVVSRRRRAA